MTLRFLVVEGDVREARESRQAAVGKTASRAYADVLMEIAPDTRCDICLAADATATLPEAAGLENYDAVFVTGSALNVYNGGREVEQQIELARAVFRSRTPFFGSCWGLQIAAAAAGGDVVRNPLGREIGFARNIALTVDGAPHPLFRGRPAAFDAPCTHLDIVKLPSQGARSLAQNPMSPVQAAEIWHLGGQFCGVQYHPEYSLAEIASLLERRAGALVAEGLLRAEEDARSVADDVRELEVDPSRRDIAWRLGLDAEVIDPFRRRTELRNFIDLIARRGKPAAF